MCIPNDFHPAIDKHRNIAYVLFKIIFEFNLKRKNKSRLVSLPWFFIMFICINKIIDKKTLFRKTTYKTIFLKENFPYHLLLTYRQVEKVSVHVKYHQDELLIYHNRHMLFYPVDMNHMFVLINQIESIQLLPEPISTCDYVANLINKHFALFLRTTFSICVTSSLGIRSRNSA